MSEQKMLIQCLQHYCDLVWEYNSTSKKIYIHYDFVAKENENGTYTVSELVNVFKEKYKFVTNDYMWQNYLNDEYLESFFDSDKKQEEFEIQFIVDNSHIVWYCIKAERTDSDSLIITGKNMYNAFKERSMYNSVKESFENIISINVQTKTCIVIHAKRISPIPARTYAYDDTMKLFVDKYASEEEKEHLKSELALDYVVKRLRDNNEYGVYINMHSASNKTNCKKITFSYTDKSQKFITFSTLNIGEIVGRYEKLLKKAQKENFRDSLTGIYNRNYYETNVKNRKVSGGVAVFDIDNFKLCNDMYGHGVGDNVLTLVADTVKSEISANDILIRYGGDEFLLLMPEASASETEEKLKKIKKRINKASIDISDMFEISLSIGGAAAKDEVAKDAVRRADRLMYRAKIRRNCIVTEQSPTGVGNAEGAEKLANRIMIVDDSEINRGILAEMLKADFEIIEAADGEECMKLLKEYGNGISLILLDLIMPNMDGFEVLTEMNKLHCIDNVPVIIITADQTEEGIRCALSLGAVDCIRRPYDSRVVMQRIYNTVKLYSRQRELTSMLTKQIRKNENNGHVIINVLSDIIGTKNGESTLHINHMRRITAMLLERLVLKTDKYGLTWSDCEMIAEIAALHDIGKLEIDDKILNKHDNLTEKEREIIKNHTLIGERIFRTAAAAAAHDEPVLETAAQICRWHHEKYDGTGYPDGLSGDDIPIAAQAVSLANIYDTLMSGYVFKKTYSQEETLNIICSEKREYFNPLLLECLQDINNNIIDEIYGEYRQ